MKSFWKTSEPNNIFIVLCEWGILRIFALSSYMYRVIGKLTPGPSKHRRADSWFMSVVVSAQREYT